MGVYAIDDVRIPQLVKTVQQAGDTTRRMIRRMTDLDLFAIEDDALWIAVRMCHARQLYALATVRREVLRAYFDEAGHPRRKVSDRALKGRYFLEELPKYVLQTMRGLSSHEERCCAPFCPSEGRMASPKTISAQSCVK